MPIRRSAASMPALPLSNPSPARARMAFSSSRAAAKVWEEDFSAAARCSREAVRVSCSVVWWVRRVSVFRVEGPGWREREVEVVFAVLAGGAFVEGGWRDRRVEVRFVVSVDAFERVVFGGWVGASSGLGSASSRSISSPSPGVSSSSSSSSSSCSSS